MQKRDRELLQLFQASFRFGIQESLGPLKCMLAQSAYQISDYRTVIRLLGSQNQPIATARRLLPLSEAYLRAGQLSDAKTLPASASCSPTTHPDHKLAIVQMTG